MSSYITDNYNSETNKEVYSPTKAAVERAHHAERLMNSDTIAQLQGWSIIKKASMQHARAQLPPPQSQIHSDQLSELATAFGEAFKAMREGIDEGMHDYTQVTEVSQSQSQGVLTSTSDAIAKEEAAMKAEAAAQPPDWLDTFNKASFWVGIGLIAVTVLLGLVTGGAAEAAVPEEIEMVALDGGEEVAEEPALAADMETPGELDEAETATVDSDVVTENNEMAQVEESSQTQTSTLESNGSQAGAKSGALETLKKLAQLGLKGGFTALLASPMLVNGIVNILLSKKHQDLANVEADVGTAMAIQEQNNMYYQFFQQLAQRQGGIQVEQTKDAGEIIETFGNISSGYRSISQGLANTV